MDYYKNQTYYDILGVKQDTSLENIRKAINRLKFGDPDDRAPFSMWNKIDEAYAVLSDIEKRKEYDKKLEQLTNDNLNIDKSIDLKVSEDKINNIQNNVNVETLPTKDETEDSNDFYNNEIKIENKKENTYINLKPNTNFVIEKDINILQDSYIVPKLKKVGKEVILALPTAVLATIKIIKELNNRNEYILSKESAEKNISEIKTFESELENEYRKKLDEEVDKVLDQHHSNYNLEIDKLRYENHIELLNKKIELKENEVVKKGGLIKYKLQLTALRKQLQEFEVSLNRVNDKLNQNQRNQKLSRIHKNLIEVNEQIKQNKTKTIALKKLEIRHQNLLNKKKLKASRIKSNREYYAIFKDSFKSAHAVSENFVDNVFVPADKVDYITRLR